MVENSVKKESIFFEDETKNVNMGFIETKNVNMGFTECEESFVVMYEKENLHVPKNDYITNLKNNSLDYSFIRNQALEWIFKVHSYYCFGPLSFCLSINFLDRYLSVSDSPRGKTWAVQLLAVACLSLAIKMVETTVTLTVDLQVCGPVFVFEGKTIQRMELLVLSTLDWQLQACTPFTFIDFFLRKFNDDVQVSSMALVARSYQLITSTVKGMEFLEFRSSEIAAAVAISVSTRTTSDIDTTLSNLHHVVKERVQQCVQLMKDLKLVGMQSNSSTAVANDGVTSSYLQTPTGVLDDVSYLSHATSNTDINPSQTSPTHVNKRIKLE